MDEPYDVDALLGWRSRRDERFWTHYASPIPEEDLPTFTGLRYFEPNPDWVVRGTFAPADGKVDITSSTGSVAGYNLAGYALLAFEEQTIRLVVLAGEEGEAYIPFRDATCDSEPYPGGRYVPAIVTEEDRVTVDFNRAANPLCAYDEEFSCPMPPAENRLAFAITAGEKAYVAD